MASISSGLVTIPLCSLITEIFWSDTYTKESSKPWCWDRIVWKDSSMESSLCKALIKHSVWVCANRITPEQSDMHSSRTHFSKALEKNHSIPNLLVNHFTGISWVHRFMYLLISGLCLLLWHSGFNTWSCYGSYRVHWLTIVLSDTSYLNMLCHGNIEKTSVIAWVASLFLHKALIQHFSDVWNMIRALCLTSCSVYGKKTLILAQWMRTRFEH